VTCSGDFRSEEAFELFYIIFRYFPFSEQNIERFYKLKSTFPAGQVRGIRHTLIRNGN